MAAAAQTAQAAQTTQSAAEQFTFAGNQAFKDAVEKSLAALAETNTYSKQNLEAMVASATAAAKGAEIVGAQAMAYSKKQMEDQVAAAQKFAQVKSVQEAVELQTAFARSAMETYLAGMTSMSEAFTASLKDTMKPLNERVTATVERFQSAR